MEDTTCVVGSMIVVYTEFHKYCRLYLSAIIVLDKVPQVTKICTVPFSILTLWWGLLQWGGPTGVTVSPQYCKRALLRLSQ